MRGHGRDLRCRSSIGRGFDWTGQCPPRPRSADGGSSMAVRAAGYSGGPCYRRRSNMHGRVRTSALPHPSWPRAPRTHERHGDSNGAAASWTTISASLAMSPTASSRLRTLRDPQSSNDVSGMIAIRCGPTGPAFWWRRGRDSNPRYPCEYAAFRVRCFQPLSHLSRQGP